jgi:hypothetical protein
MWSQALHHMKGYLFRGSRLCALELSRSFLLLRLQLIFPRLLLPTKGCLCSILLLVTMVQCLGFSVQGLWFRV